VKKLPPSIQEQCKTLKLSRIPQIYHDIPFENREQYLSALLAKEIESRNSNKASGLLKRASFPTHKNLKGFEWDHIQFPPHSTVTDLVELSFLENRENILALGSVGTGKTHLAIALGIKACMAGKKVRFYRCQDLVNKLLDKHSKGKLAKFMKELGKLDLLILDEMGFVPIQRKGAELLFNVIANAYEQYSVIVTSNLQFGEWGSILGDTRLTAALIDRLVYHAIILGFEGESYRLRKALIGINDVDVNN
jgi:DNA replication protein DnaC